MTEQLIFTKNDLAPDRSSVFQLQGIPTDTDVSTAIADLCDAAIGLLSDCARPAGILERVTVDDMARIFDGEGRNDPSPPLEHIYPRAEHLALFAVTLGPGVTEEIAARSRAGDYAPAHMLDSVASVAVDHLAKLAQRRFFEMCRPRPGSPLRALHYSPGYCGWHVTGQRALFERLRPEAIGITLNDGCMMIPTKSISGVVVVGPGEIHDFDPTYECCDTCRTRTCRERISALNLGANDRGDLEKE